ncbi:hypothetical protein BpHYR1_035947 [Brachionus plicatilis]|uniref:Uncharacterized protein n=1 Tax=Brachionus plicatilis TaxID=10195 RepID=A0A3M7QRP4_BRAPC|nr:hypothetical protein BpHYR1_035947 [Brachionus plicatilis]
MQNKYQNRHYLSRLAIWARTVALKSKFYYLRLNINININFVDKFYLTTITKRWMIIKGINSNN